MFGCFLRNALTSLYVVLPVGETVGKYKTSASQERNYKFFHISIDYVM